MEVKNGSGIRGQKFWNEGLYQDDECPVCSRLLQYPIYECELGHIICCDCVDCMECPLCKLSNNKVYRRFMKNKSEKAKLHVADVESIIEQVKRIDDTNTTKIKSQKIANPKLKQEKVRKQQSKKSTIEVLIQTDSESERQIEKPLNFLRKSLKNASDKTNAPKLKKITTKTNFLGLTEECLDFELGKGKLKKYKDEKVANPSSKLITIPEKKISKQAESLVYPQIPKKVKDEKASVCKNKKPKGEKKSAEKKPKGEKDLVNQTIIAIVQKLTPPLLVVVRSEETLTKSEEAVIVKKDFSEDTEYPIHPSNSHQEIIEKSLTVNSIDRENNLEHELKVFIPNDDVYKYNEFLCSYLEPVLEPNMSISVCKTLTESSLLTEFLRSNGDFLSPEIVNVNTSLCCVPEENTNLVFEEPQHFDLNANYTDVCLYEQLANVFEYITDTELIDELNNTSQLLEECVYKFSKSIENFVDKDLAKLRSSSCEILDVTDLTEIEIYHHDDSATKEDLSMPVNSSESISPAPSTKENGVPDELIVRNIMNELVEVICEIIDSEANEVLEQSKAENSVPDELIVRNMMNELVEVICEIIDSEAREVLEQSKSENSNGNDIPEMQSKSSKHELDEKFEFVQGEQTFLTGEKRTECTDFEIYTDGFVEPFMKLSKEDVTAKFVEDDTNFTSTEELSDVLLETPSMIPPDNFGESLSEKASDEQAIESIEKTLNKLLKTVSENIEKKILDEILEKDLKKSLQDSSENIEDTALIEIPEKDFKKSLKRVCVNDEESSLVEIPEKDTNYVAQTSWDRDRDSVLNTLDQLINKVDETMQNQCLAVVDGDSDLSSQSWFTFTVRQIFDLFNEIKTLTSSAVACDFPRPLYINYDRTSMQKSSQPKFEHGLALDIQHDLNENHKVTPVSQYWLEELLEMNTEFDKDDLFLPTTSNKISVNTVDKILKRGNQIWTYVSKNEDFPGETNVDIFVAEKIKLDNARRSQQLSEFPNRYSGTFQDEYFVPASSAIIPYCSVSSNLKAELRNSLHLFPSVLSKGLSVKDDHVWPFFNPNHLLGPNGIPEESKPVVTSVSVATGMDDEQEVACQVGASLISLNEEEHDHSVVSNMNLQACSPMKISTIDDTDTSNNYIADFTHSCVDEVMETVLYSLQNACIAAKKGVNAVIGAHQDVELDCDLSTNTCISFVDPDIDPGVMELEDMYFDALDKE